MDLGIGLPTKAKSWEVCKRAEELGCTHAWFYDTQLLNAEMFAAMGAAAMKTSKIKLCTGVVIPSNRLAPVTASGLGTINALAPGRVVFGISTGFTGRRTLGLRPITLARLEEYIRVVQGLLRGETVDWSEEGGTHKIRFLNPELDLINIKDPIPLFLSAFGPKARRLTAKLNAGWIGAASYPEHEKADIEDIKGAMKEFGHDPTKLYAVAGMGGCVLDEGERPDSPRAKAQAGPYAAIAFHNLVEEEEFGSVFGASSGFPLQEELEAYRKIYLKYEPADARYLSNHRGHLMFLRPEEKHISEKVMRVLTLTGTKSELVERVRGLKQLGYSQINLQTVPGQENDMLERWADVMAKV
jgi:5,10-methylenetetrahydromethanopterin reductase